MPKQKKKDRNDNEDKFVTLSADASITKRKRRRRGKNKNNKANNSNNNNITQITKSVSTKAKHAAPPNAATIYCKWYQQGLCHRGNKCFFIHGLDPLSDKNPITHQKMIRKLQNTNNDDQHIDQSKLVQVALKRPSIPIPTKNIHPYPSTNNMYNNAALNDDDDAEFILPSQNKQLQMEFAQKQQPPPPLQPPPIQHPPPPNYNNHYINPINPPTNPSMYPPNQAYPPQPQLGSNLNVNAQPFDYNNNMNMNAMNGVNTQFAAMHVSPPHQQQPQYNPYQQPQLQFNPYANAYTQYPPQYPPQTMNHNMASPNGQSMYSNNNPYINPSDFIDPNKINVNDELLEHVEDFNEDDYEVWEDENGEIIVIEKSQLYSDNDNMGNQQKLGDQFNHERSNKNKNPNQRQKGLGGGGSTYMYGNVRVMSNNDTKNKKVMNENEYPALESPNTKKSKSRRSNRRKKKRDYANMATKYNDIFTTDGFVESKTNDNDDPDYDVNTKICTYWLVGTCTYGDACKMAHRFENEDCPHCGTKIGKSIPRQKQHIAVCTGKALLDEELKISKTIDCGICHENICKKHCKFGLLTGCNHAFCLECIREWRGVLHQSKEVVRSCPICREMTWFIVPCDRLVTNPKRKEQIINGYKNRLNNIVCRHFAEDETCPFGTSCFYKHIKKDGSMDDRKLKLRHLVDGNGETKILKEMKLSEFLFGE